MVRKGVVAVLCAGLLGCPGTPEQDSGVPQPVTDSGVVVTPPKYTVGGIVTGLTGALTLRVRDVPFNVGADGAFEVPGTFDDGEMYALSVDVQPFRQECALTRGDGTVRGADVTDVLISCRNKYVVGGTITGLTRDSLTLTMGAQSLTVHAGATRFEFLDGLVEGSMWAMSLATDPGAQSCRFTTPEAGVVTADVSVQVACMDGQFDIPGFAEGVNAPITLVDELSSSEVTVSASGSFQIVLRGPPLRQYRVAIKTPSLSQYCTLENTEGFLRPGNPMPVLLKCTDKRRLVFMLEASGGKRSFVSVNSDGTLPLDPAPSVSSVSPAMDLRNRVVRPTSGRMLYFRANAPGTAPGSTLHSVNVDGGNPLLLAQLIDEDRFCFLHGETAIYERDGGVHAVDIRTGAPRRLVDGACVDLLDSVVISEAPTGTTATSLDQNAQYFLGQERARSVVRDGSRFVLSSANRVWAVGADGTASVTLGGGGALPPELLAGIDRGSALLAFNGRAYWLSRDAGATPELQSTQLDGTNFSAVAANQNATGLWQAGQAVVASGALNGARQLLFWDSNGVRRAFAGEPRGEWHDRFLRLQATGSGRASLDLINPADGTSTLLAIDVAAAGDDFGVRNIQQTSDGGALMYFSIGAGDRRSCAVVSIPGAPSLSLFPPADFGRCLGFNGDRAYSQYRSDGGLVTASASVGGGGLVEHRLGDDTSPVFDVGVLSGESLSHLYAVGPKVDGVEIVHSSFESSVVGTIWGVPGDGGVPRALLNGASLYGVVFVGTD